MVNIISKPFYLRNMESEDDLKRVSFNMQYFPQVEAYFNANHKNRHAIICPAGDSDESSKQTVITWIKRPDLPYVYYVPFDFTDQIDPKQGLTICNTMHDAIYFADTIDVLLNKTMKDVWFDIGIGFFYGNKFQMIEKPTWNDEYTQFLEGLCNADPKKVISRKAIESDKGTLNDKLKDFRTYVNRKDEYEFNIEFEDYKTQTRESLIKFGIIFAALKHLDDKSFKLANKDEALYNSMLEDKETPPILKSYTKVALRLDDIFAGKR